MLNWIREAVGQLAAPLTEYIRGRNQRSQTRAEAQADDAARDDAITASDLASRNEMDAARERAAAEIAHTQTEAERDWDREVADQAKVSWKDEWWTVIFGLPILIAFIPGGAGFVASGFAAISAAPGWYQTGVAASVAFSFGIRHVVQVMQSRWGRR